MSNNSNPREAPDDDDNWVTVGARPRQRTVAPPSAPAYSAGGTRRKRPDQPASARRPENRENDWQLVMRSRQALTKLRDEDFALTRLGQVHTEPRKPNPRPANRSRLGAKFPTEMASDRPNRPTAVLRRPARLVMPKFDLPLRSEADFPSLRGGPEPAAPPPAAATERRRSSVALKLDESLRSMAGAAAHQAEPAAAAASAASAPMPPPPSIRPVAYSEAVSWRTRPARKSERRDAMRGEIREDVAMLKTAAAPKTPTTPKSATTPKTPVAPKSTVESPSTTSEATPSSGTSGESPQKKKEKEKRLLKKAKKKESQLILARMNASKDTHVQLVTADAFERLHGAHGGRWRRSQAETVDLRAPDQYPSLAETAVASAAAPDPPPVRESPRRSSASHEPQPPDRRDGGVKTYSRMLRELPKTLPPPVSVRELVETKEAKKKAPKKRAPIEANIMELAEFMPSSRARRAGALEGQEPQLSGEEVSPSQRAATRRLVRPVRVIGNRLDSSVLVHKRGKERTKKKKPSLLKRVILQERAERRRRLGLESAAAALFAGLSVKEPVVVVSGQVVSVKEETGDEVQTAPVVKQDAETQKMDSDVKQERAGGVTDQPTSSGADQHTSPQKQYVILKRETSTPISQTSTSEIKQSTPVQEPVQKVIPKIKQEVISPTSSQNVSQEAKPAASPGVGSAQVTSVSVKQESESTASSTVYNTLKAKPSESSEPNSAPSQDVSQNDQKPDVAPAIADTDPKSGGDGDDDDEPPSRGPDYTPCVTVDPKLLIHSRKFREYCQQTLSSDIDDSARLLLQDLTRFQDRLYNRDPIKARARRRLVFGLREVSKHLAIKKLACVILAPNIEKIETAGGLDQAVQRLLTLASEREVPLVFALKRRALGHACKKPVPVSCVGIFNYQGSEDNYKRLMQLTEAAQERYRAMVADVERALRPPSRTEELSPAEQLLGVIDEIGRQRLQPLPPADDATDDPTHSLLAKLRSATLGDPVSG